MRIISGKWKGKPLDIPLNLPIRPTTDKAKQALFNILENRFSMDQIFAMDLFSGSGNISYELASRGSRSILAIEKNPVCCRYIRSQIIALQLETIQLIQADVYTFIETIMDKFDLIFADPPYNQTNINPMIEKILTKGLLNKDGLFVLEHSSLLLTKHIQGYLETRIYGSSAFSLFTNII